jgi:hypothetical protein
MVWKPGQSGNPLGRALKVEDISPYARKYGREAVDTMVRCLKDPKWCLPAAIALLDRGFGKPKETMQLDGNATLLLGGIDRPPRETLEEWLARRRNELKTLDAPADSTTNGGKSNGHGE